jgi:phenylpyruvate tautomerase PptA (4-oxalocrotonate tautomerase family)
MPLIEVTTFDISKEEKIRLVNELAQKAHEITGIDLEYFTVIIREVSGPECWGNQGKSILQDPKYRIK